MVSSNGMGAGIFRRKWVRITMIATGIVVALLGIAAILLVKTFQPTRLDLPKVEVGPLPAASPPAEMSISALPTGIYENPAMFAFRGGSMDDVRQFAATAVLVRHPKGHLLIDTGFGKNVDAHMKLLPSMQQAPHHVKIPIVEQMKAARISPDSIAGVIPTHAHWDHISGVEDLHGVPVLVTTEGLGFIKSRAEGTAVINSFSNTKFRKYKFDGGAYLGFPKSHDIWSDGSVVVVPAPGHTPDSVIVFVNLPSGKRFAFVGDLVWQLDGLHIPAEKPWMLRWFIGEDREETNRDIALIRAATRSYPQIIAVPAHDGNAFGAIKSFPQVTR